MAQPNEANNFWDYMRGDAAPKDTDVEQAPEAQASAELVAARRAIPVRGPGYDARGLTAELPVSFRTTPITADIANAATDVTSAFAAKQRQLEAVRTAHEATLTAYQQARELAAQSKPVPEKIDPLLEEKRGLLKAQTKRALQPTGVGTAKGPTIQKWQVDNYNGIRARTVRDRSLVGAGLAKVTGYDNGEMQTSYDYDNMKPEVKQALDFSNQIVESVAPDDPKFKGAIQSLNTMAAQAATQGQNNVAQVYGAQAKYLKDWATDRAPVARLVEKYAAANGAPAGTYVEPQQPQGLNGATLDNIEAELRARGALPQDTTQ